MTYLRGGLASGVGPEPLVFFCEPSCPIDVSYECFHVVRVLHYFGHGKATSAGDISS